jgi:hypothetical protein
MEIGYPDARLSFSIEERLKEETQFVARVRDQHFSGEVVSSDYVVGTPAVLFVEMANTWRGWEGSLAWADLEDSLRLEAKSNSVGQIQLTVEMRRFLPEAKLITNIQIDAGQLEQIAREMLALFET